MSAEDECIKLKKKSLINNNNKINTKSTKNESNETVDQTSSVFEFNSLKSNLEIKNKEDESDESDKQMLGGCCVCGDDTGPSNNLLVYCDGIDCKVAVHQCCYGILNVPDDSWYCGSCKHKIDLASSVFKTKNTLSGQYLFDEFKKLSCELCPCRDGALKRTQNNKWAHVVCALYVPEISFGNVKTMEPIILKDIKAERFERKCSICQNEETSLSQGVYVNCADKNGCKEWFHVTCAQRKGLLCEESNTQSKNNLNYSIYCNLHSEKLLNQSTNCVKKLPSFNISLCPVSNPSNKNNLAKSLSNLIHFINKSINSNKIDNDLSSFFEQRDKEKHKEKLKQETKKNYRTASKQSISKEPIVDLSEKKKKKFSFNNSSSLNQQRTITKPTNVNKFKLESNETNESDKKSIDSKVESKLDEINLKERKESDVNSNVIPKLQDTKSIEVIAEKVDCLKNDDCSSIKSFQSNSTTRSISKTKRKLINTQSNNDNENIKSKTTKLDNEDSNDNLTNMPPELHINLEDTKLSCHGGIVTPSTSSCASSTSSNFSKSPDSIDLRPKCKAIQSDLRLINHSQTHSIDAFGNFLNKQMTDANCETISRSREEEIENASSLEELLKKQWDLGSSLCENLSKNFDCMDLLDLLYKCKQENLEMEKKLKLLEQTNLENEHMNKKLSQSFTKVEEPVSVKKLIPSLNEQTTSLISFNKVINDQVQNHVISNKSSFQSSANSMNYSNLIQQSLSYLHSKPSHLSSSPSNNNNNNSLLNLYNKQMQNHSSAQSNSQANYQTQTTTTWNPALSNSPTKSTISAPNNVNSSCLSSLLNQNQLLQSFQQLNPMQQQQIASYYYMAAASNTSSQSIAPSTSTNFNT